MNHETIKGVKLYLVKQENKYEMSGLQGCVL